MGDAAGTTNHTPGPWAYEQWPDSGGFPRPVVVAQGSRAVAYMSREDGYANARLIAAAPDLLAACEAVANADAECSCYERCECREEAMAALRAAVTAAKGGCHG